MLMHMLYEAATAPLSPKCRSRWWGRRRFAQCSSLINIPCVSWNHAGFHGMQCVGMQMRFGLVRKGT